VPWGAHEVQFAVPAHRVRAHETTWPDLAEGLYERLSGRGSQISYRFDGLEIEVPRDTSKCAPRAAWRLDGTLHITTSERPS